MVQDSKKIAILHRYPYEVIKETNAAIPYLLKENVDLLTFKKFNRVNSKLKFWKSLAWILYAPLLVWGKGYDVIYLDDSYPFYGILVKLVCPKAKVVKRIGDFHLMYYYSGKAYRLLHFIEKIEWRMMDRIIAISDVMAEHIYKEIKRPVEIAYDPVELNDFLPINTLKDKSRKIVMFHGLLTKNKNIDMLLEAAKGLPVIDFEIIGDGPDKERLEQYVPCNVYFRGWVRYKYVCAYINNCDIGIALRSNNPGNEFVVTSPFLQYGAMGKPCLVTKRKVFGDYEWQFTGIDELVAKINLLLDRPEEGEKMRRYILEHHDAKKISDKIWSILNG